MKSRLLFGIIAVLIEIGALSQESWPDALAKMPVRSANLINRDNCISICVTNFQSNAAVKALIFSPSVSDDFYLINRDRPKLDIRATDLFDALRQLTNTTDLQLTFKSPFLLVHSRDDLLDPRVSSQHAPTVRSLEQHRVVPHLECVDRHWDSLQPILQTNLGLKLRPETKSEQAWHFGRHNFVAWNLTDWELLQCITLAAGTSAVVRSGSITFEVARWRVHERK